MITVDNHTVAFDANELAAAAFACTERARQLEEMAARAQREVTVRNRAQRVDEAARLARLNREIASRLAALAEDGRPVVVGRWAAA